MALIKKTPNTPRTAASWRRGDLEDDLSELHTKAAIGDLDAQMRLKMLDELSTRPGPDPNRVDDQLAHQMASDVLHLARTSITS